MLVESITIVLVVLMIVVVFLRAKKYDYAIKSLTLLVVPVGNILAILFGRYILRAFQFFDSLNHVIIVFNVTALVITGVLIGISAGKFKSSKTRLGYIILFGAFNIALACIFIFNGTEGVADMFLYH